MDREEEADLRLRRLIRWFDSTDNEWRTRALTRAVARAGRLLVVQEGFGPEHPVSATIAAAEAFLARPGAESYAAYFAAASRSYPFGAGEGCYRMRGADDCLPGSGCRSGAGTLAQVASVVGARAVWEAIASRRSNTI